MSDANLLDVRGLTKSQGARKIVERVNLQVNRGEIVALLGRNDAGKSATLRMLTGELKPDDGAIKLLGSVMTDLDQAVAATGPVLLVLDEPFAGKSPETSAALKARILKLAGQGVGILFADHDARGSLDFCDRAYVMSDGRIATSGSASGLLAPQ